MLVDRSATRTAPGWTKSQFHRSDLRGASLKDAKLSGTDFAKSDLREADFSGADPLTEVTFNRCDRRGARLARLQFQAVSLSGSLLSGIDLTLATGSISLRPINIGSADRPRSVEGDEALRWLEGAGAKDLSYVPMVTR